MPVILKEPDFVKDMYSVSEWDDVSAALKSPVFIAERKVQLPTRENILVFINGKEHLERRQIESPVFSRDVLVEYERTTLAPLLERYVRRWREQGGTELVNETLMVLVRIGALLAGVGELPADEDAHRIMQYVDAFSAAGSVEYAKLPDEGKQQIVDHAEALAHEFNERYIAPARAARTEMLAQVERGELETSALPRDLITQLLAHWNDEWKPLLLSLEVLAYLTGSVRTSMRAVCNAVDEIHRWVTAHPEDEPHMADPAFVRKAVNETLRVHVVAPVLLRMTAEAVTLPSGLEIPAGEYVAVLYARANRDPRYFGDDADEFDPHRSERGLSGRDYGFSFAAGEHACIGRRLAVGAGGDADSANNGTVMTLIEELMKLGVRPDPEDPPVPNDASFYDEFLRYPVKFVKR